MSRLKTLIIAVLTCSTWGIAHAANPAPTCENVDRAYERRVCLRIERMNAAR